MQDEPGVLNRISSLVRRRNFNIESIVAGRTEKEGITRMTLVVNEPDINKRKTIINNIKRLVEIYDVVDATGKDCHIREHALVKISIDEKNRKDIDGLVCSNTTVNHNYPYEGGLSGEELFEISNKNLVSLRHYLGTSFPIIASGGVMSRDHFQKKIDLGADLVQIYTGMIYKGPVLIKEILDS